MTAPVVDLSAPCPGQFELPGFEVGQGDLFDAMAESEADTEE